VHSNKSMREGASCICLNCCSVSGIHVLSVHRVYLYFVGALTEFHKYSRIKFCSRD